MELKGKKIAILVEDMYHDIEFWYPYYRIQEAGGTVTVVGTGKMEYKSKTGVPAKENMKAENASADDFDGVIIPGGFAPDIMRRSAAMLKLVKDLDAQGKLVAAICHAGWVVISAGILKNRTATSFFAIKDDMTNAGANWVDQEVVIDHNLVTSRVPDDLPAFLRAIIRVLQG